MPPVGLAVTCRCRTPSSSSSRALARHTWQVSISVLSRKQLWGRAGNRCAFPHCRDELNEPSANPPGGVVVGEEAHIVAREEDGPRGDSPLIVAQRDEYTNLILLCRRHHKIVDTDVAAHSVQSLLRLKDDHERWVRATLDIAGQAMMERYAQVLDTWSQTVVLHRWHDLTDGLAIATGPGIPNWGWNALVDTDAYLRSVVWPGGLPDLERAFTNFSEVLADLINVFDDGQPDAQLDGRWLRLTAPRHPRSEDDWQRFARNRDLVTNLALELTRATNRVCDVARTRVDPQFRLVEGHAAVTFQDDSPKFPQYRPAELAVLYPGLNGFAAVLPGRDLRVLPGSD